MKFCDEKSKLIKRYEAATSAYADAIRELQQGIAKLANGFLGKAGLEKVGLEKFDYERSFLATEEARYTTELARAALLHHVREHHC